MAEIKGNGGSVGGGFVCLTLTLNQVLALGEQCNRIVYSKFAGMKPDKPRVPMTYRS